ncbi:hypothetical protein A7K94_0219795, partial [Modestobacter sp. VKM Ac-2676]
MTTLESTLETPLETTAAPLSRPAPHAGAGVFLREFLRAPLRTASVVPSSRALAARMIAPLQRPTRRPGPPVVVELGPGTGSFTAALHEAVPDVRYLGIELNPVLADHLSARLPGIDLVRGPASVLPRRPRRPRPGRGRPGGERTAVAGRFAG